MPGQRRGYSRAGYSRPKRPGSQAATSAWECRAARMAATIRHDGAQAGTMPADASWSTMRPPLTCGLWVATTLSRGGTVSRGRSLFVGTPTRPGPGPPLGGSARTNGGTTVDRGSFQSFREIRRIRRHRGTSPATAWMHANVGDGGRGSMHAIVGKPYDPLRRVLGVLHDWNATAAGP